MKRFILIILIVFMLSAVAGHGLSEPFKYRYQWQKMRTLISHYDYAELIDYIESLAADHPLLMPEEWKANLLSLANTAQEGFPSFNSEYDIFDNITYEWFGESKKPEAKDQCVVANRKDGWGLYFHFDLEKSYIFSKYAAVINQSIRTTGNIKEIFHDHDGSVYYEEFVIPISFYDMTEAPESIAFRFYGKNENNYIDYALSEDEVSQYIQIAKMFLAKQDLDDLVYEWVLDIEPVDDLTIPPQAFVIFLNKEYPIFPDGTTTEDLHRTDNKLQWKLEESLDNKKFVSGSYYFLPCTLIEITEPSKSTPQRAWIASLKKQYDTSGSYSEIRIVVDHALDMQWITEEPAPGDEIIVLGTYLGIGSVSGMHVFYMGSDEYTDELIEKLSK